MKEFLAALLALFIYAQAAWATGTYYYQHRCDPKEKSLTCGPESFLVGYGWPLYWHTRFWLEVTK